MKKVLSALLFSGLWIGVVTSIDAADSSAVVKSEFIFEQAPFRSCHASTIAESEGHLLAAWFGGTAEKNPDVGIWFSREDGGKWSAPVEVANGVQPGGGRVPTWNPVMFQPRQGPLLLFYKAGPSPSKWWGMLMTSTNGGATWSAPSRLPEGILGPIKNKPVELVDGTILCGSSTEDRGWRVQVERTRDLGKTWEKTEPLNDPKVFGAIQPGILIHGPAELELLCRSQQKVITSTRSTDGGKTWSAMERTELPNPNSGIDAVTLRDGRDVLVYNDTPRGRSPLNVAVRTRGGSWKPALVLESEPGEFSYPAVMQGADGMVHVTYTWQRRRIRHVVIDPARLSELELNLNK